MPGSSGLVGSLKRLVSTALAIVQTRLELLSNELEEERLRIRQMFLYGCVVLFCFGLAIMLLTVFVVVLFWDSHRLLVLGALTGFFFIAGLLAAYALRRLAQQRQKLFATSLAELSDDLRRLSPRP